MTSRRARERANASPWEAGEQPEPDDHQHAGDFPDLDHIEQDDDYEGSEDPECHWCRGDGMDPYTDYLLPCPHCQGEQRP